MFLICGEALFDVFVKPQQSINSLHLEAHAGGSPFNVAIGISRLGGHCALLGGVSNDLLGQRLEDILRTEGVNCDYLVHADLPTPLSLVGTDEQGQPSYSFYSSETADRSIVQSKLPNFTQAIHGFHFGSYSLVAQPTAQALWHLCQQHQHQFISLDPNVRSNVEPDLDIWREKIQQFVRYANVVKVSSEDILTLFPSSLSKRSSAQFEKVASDWIAEGVSLVIVTDGEKPVNAWTSRQLHLQLDTNPSEVADTVGAGDSFQAALLCQLQQFCKQHSSNLVETTARLDKQQLQTIVTFCQSAAQLTVSRVGANLPTLAEINKYLQ